MKLTTKNKIIIDHAMGPNSFLTLANLKKFGASSLTDFTKDIYEDVGADISVPHMSGILKRLEKKNFISSPDKRGKRGKPKKYTITEVGEANFRNALFLFKELVKHGEDSFYHEGYIASKNLSDKSDRDTSEKKLKKKQQKVVPIRSRGANR